MINTLLTKRRRDFEGRVRIICEPESELAEKGGGDPVPRCQIRASVDEVRLDASETVTSGSSAFARLSEGRDGILRAVCEPMNSARGGTVRIGRAA